MLVARVVIAFLAPLLLQCLSVVQGSSNSSQEDINNRTLLHFLNILPFPRNQDNAGWDRAYELIPAAQLAMDHINQAPDILKNFELNLVTVQSESCGITFINEGLINPYAKVFDKKQSLNVVGMGGLFCSTVTNMVTSVFSSPSVTYLQLAGSTTPVHRNSSRFPWLVHFVSSSTIFNDAVLAIMRAFQWKKISIIYDTSGIFFKSDAVDFLKRAQEEKVDIVTALPLPVDNAYSKIFPILTNARSRVIYITAPNTKCARVMCEAYRYKAMYPGYVYIFHDKTATDIISRANSTDCSSEELMEAVEGVFFIKYNLMADENVKLVSNMTYGDYYQDYIKMLRSIESTQQISLDRTNIYANVMYDQIWAFALAVQGSLEKLKDHGVDIKDLHLHQTNLLAATLKSEIRNISFQGASGYISFNSDIEDKSLVRVFQVVNGTEELMGEYNGEFNNGLCTSKANNDTLCLINKHLKPPPDTFETRTRLLPPWVSSFISVTIALCVVATTSIFILLYVLLRKQPEVKASSLSLSIIMYIGCYFVFVAALMRNISRSYEIASSATFTAACNLEMWLGSTGMTLIFSALLMRLLRIYNIFKTYGKVSKFWKDRYLILCILVISSGEIFILAMWTITDRIRAVSTTEYQPNASPPYFEIHSICSCNSLGPWFSAVFSYNGILMALIVLMAIQTRKIKRTNFKDTKKTNAFIAITCMSMVILFSLWFILEVALQDYIGGHIIACFGFLCTGIYCQIFIFLPIIISTLTRRRMGKKTSFTKIDYVQELQARSAKPFNAQQLRATLFKKLFYTAFVKSISISSSTELTSD